MWVRGLKRVRMVVSCLNKSVAPYVGAWIETYCLLRVMRNTLMSHPMWVRGLKRFLNLHVLLLWFSSHPMWVRGLKPFDSDNEHGKLSRTLCGCVD